MREKKAWVRHIPRVATSWYAVLNKNMATETCAREHSIANVL